MNQERLPWHCLYRTVFESIAGLRNWLKNVQILGVWVPNVGLYPHLWDQLESCQVLYQEKLSHFIWETTSPFLFVFNYSHRELLPSVVSSENYLLLNQN
jgi:hypothetical protein